MQRLFLEILALHLAEKAQSSNGHMPQTLTANSASTDGCIYTSV